MLPVVPGRGKPAKEGRRASGGPVCGGAGGGGVGTAVRVAEEVGALLGARREGRVSVWRSGLPAVDPGPRPLCSLPCPQTLAAVMTALPRSSPAELTISALSLALLVPVKELNVRFRDRLPTPIPGEIAMVRTAPGRQPRAPRRPRLPCRKWPRPPPRGARRAVLLRRGLCQASSQTAVTLGNPPPRVRLSQSL